MQTGFGRTGNKMWGIEHHDGVEPDIMTMAKGIANGFPIGAVARDRRHRRLVEGGNISTFGGNPISATAANATIDTIVDEKLAANAHAMGKLLRDGLEALQKKFPRAIGDVRGKGLMQAHRAREGRDRERPHAGARRDRGRLFEETKKRGLLIGRGGSTAT